jgi:hypothetical protein
MLSAVDWMSNALVLTGLANSWMVGNPEVIQEWAVRDGLGTLFLEGPSYAATSPAHEQPIAFR